MMMATKAPSTSAISPSNFTFSTLDIMNRPTMMSAGAVAKLGMAPNTGHRNSERMNIAAVVREVRPVRPPSATPAELST